MNVDFTTPRGEGEKPSRGDRYGDKLSERSKTLFLGNLSFDVTVDDVRNAFEGFGEIVRLSLPTDRDSGNPKGFGYVEYGSVDEAEAALDAMKGAELSGRRLRLDYSQPRSDNGGGFGGGRGRGGFGGRGGGRGGGGFGGGRGGGGFGGGRGGGGRGGGFGGGGFSCQRKSFDY